jgi:glycosyltransferase involved in cell wall biosynthesis
MPSRRRSSSDRRICFVRQGYFPQDPRVLKEVLALRERGWSIDVVCLRGAGEAASEVVDGVRVRRLSVPRTHRGALTYLANYLNFFVRAAAVVTARHLKRRYAVVQVNNQPEFLVFAAAIAKLTGAKVVLDMHELMPEFFASRFGFKGVTTLVRGVRAVEWLSVRFSDAVFTQNHVQQEMLRRRTGVTSEILHNVPAEENFPADAATAPPPAGFPGGPPVVLTHGTVAERYGIGLMIDALPAVLQDAEAQMLVLGDGEDLERFRREADARGLSNHITFPGRVPLEEVSRWIAAATVCVLPPRRDGYMETISPNKMFEYVALGKPVCATDTPGVRDYFDETQLALFTPDDASALAGHVVRLLRDEELRGRMARNARSVYDRVRWNETKHGYTSVVAGVAGFEESAPRLGS